MTVVLLDPRFPSMIPVDAVTLLSGKVSYTEEVPIRIRWVIGDLGGHTVYESDVLVTTDLRNDLVIERIEEGDELLAAPSLLVHLSPDREIGPRDSGELAPAHTPALPSAEAIGQAMSGMGEQDPAEALESYQQYADAVDDAYQQSAHLYHQPSAQQGDEDYAADAVASAAYSGEGFVEGEVLSADEHTAAVAGSRRTARTEVPESVMDEIEDAVALMARALRQGKWEQSMTHADLVPFLREETEELASTIELRDVLAAVGSEDKADGDGEVPEWAEQDLCEELSDVLLQVLFHAEIANRRGAFDIGHVAGSFVAKLRDRAPYLFEDVERAVGIQEQNELWRAGKEAQEQRKREAHGPAFRDYLDRKAELKQQAAEQQAGQSQRGPLGAQTTEQAGNAGQGASAKQGSPAAHRAQATQGAKAQPQRAGQPAPVAQRAATAQPAQPRHTSALSAADEIIREARERGLRDADIPTDIRYPMVGLELDEPGGAEDRLLKAVQNFRQQLDRMGR
ncbi:hypothetical protein I6H52_08830 [Corynebacterium urealyticum]|uniref:MazG nucleotide pyrophosphohydrolase domain-containing protein n=1 Tax=Corynebacterium urealyticum TaxID=43771 RepID=UPI0002B3F708|nr:MazG nucleotide pyrophosphohydrolase domain-containing protein [Corynebacterium urealyticum]AGE36157.1 hypothetical protein CU7111_0563 [Corynebacterium urealyticum DSM 7111]QQB07833.1 hypothetical protein I6H53_01415 [Corynebacterium urealyticum]QQE50590.1 hypothetical protein I6H52_08830 [Corynebacterium urealyticum]